MARTKDDAKAASNDASVDITHQATEDAGVKKTPGRGRGRPKGTTSKSPTKPYVPTGKPRGRPKGSFKKGGEAKAKTPKKPLPPLAPGEKRGRGRPRKSDVAQIQEDDQAATAESEANVEAEAEDDVASNQPGIGDVTGDARTGARSALTPQQSPEYEVGPSSSFSSPAWLSRIKNMIG
ncbi:hypothetical protein M441DRAFT_56736 [Trichoderma asperellum CBS 433.97]|uniref:AT hook domain-containing protein n=1 Tax=Trichoderma asperellum (strain ATCC 204424 / CBS 433.97 / NBRC 101777) TaxID=1042311 RepID=A0A2T3ZAZ5_TRIA4|nr:hypothetical protein M441DRAFT_56736 [Trichoderma asperellum CBS 433.97]PTB41952.1 hypothetical protein M441DRAFT_56736 [Trichoderma asperellum CBS 433.97]